MWFKANCAALASSPGCRSSWPSWPREAVDPPLAIDAGRGWMLTVDRGPTLADAEVVDVTDWRRVLVRAAELQQATAQHRTVLLDAGLPDCGTETVSTGSTRLVEIFAELPYAHPSHVPPHLRARLVAQRSEIADAAAQLAASTMPATWQHGDLHPNNVFARDGRVFDFADGQWARAVEVLSVPYGWITNQTDRLVGRARGLLRGVGVPVAEVTALAAATTLTQPVNRTLLWWTCLQEATAAEWSEWGSAPLHHLTRVLDP
ncbi:phosphotransferase [Aeromicrobium sp. UC242_57]|uniref:phosphotransferase n=1 Tax=Aeromicrobium sp. UC242_57 TaxID=3374624 RepID=UPI0037C18839